jgi:replication factor C subunit 3/5
MPHLLFHGPPGTGKTSCMVAIAKELHGANNYKHMTLELNASDDRGINVVRDQIKSFCSTQQLMSRGVKLVILDECDSMTSAAQFALRRIVEKYSKTTRFCLICNYVAKVIPALQSRCTRFRFGPLTDEAIGPKLTEVCKSEGLTLSDEAHKAIISLSRGDMRKVMNILESCSLTYKEIPLTKIYEVTGRPSPEDIEEIYRTLTVDDYQTAMRTFMRLKTEKSLALDDIVRDLHKCVMETKFEDNMKMFLVQRLSEVEFRLASGVVEKPQVASIVGAFIEIRQAK